MEKTIYHPPESQLAPAQPVRLKDKGFTGFDNTMKLATAILVGFESILFAYSLYEGAFALSNIVTSFICGLASVAWIIFLIRALRGNVVSPKNQAESDSYLSIWSYVWRATIVKLLCFPLIIITLFITRLYRNFDFPSTELTMAYNLLLVFISLFLVWVFFSANRKAQLAWLLGLFRGY